MRLNFCEILVPNLSCTKCLNVRVIISFIRDINKYDNPISINPMFAENSQYHFIK